jgi:hypothetical protein
LFVGWLMSYRVFVGWLMCNCVVCRMTHVLLCCFQDGSCLIVLFLGWLMSYRVVCRMAHVLLCCL